MKTKKTYIRTIVLSVLLITAVNNIAYSQGTDSRQRYAKQGKMYAGLLITPQSTSIRNNDFSVSDALNIKGKASLGIALEGGYYFSNMVGVSVGAGIGSYSANLSLDSCSADYDTKDTESEDYEMRIKGKSITEEQKLSYLNVPVCVIIKIPSGVNLGFFVKAGLSFSIPVKKTYEGNGTFTYDGYYSAYPVLLHDIPNYFPSNVKTTSSGNLEVKSVTPALIVSGGVTYQMNESIQVLAGLLFNKSLGNISAYGASTGYMLSSKPNELKSIMEGTKNAAVQAFGLTIGVRYFIR